MWALPTSSRSLALVAAHVRNAGLKIILSHRWDKVGLVFLDFHTPGIFKNHQVIFGLVFFTPDIFGAGVEIT